MLHGQLNICLCGTQHEPRGWETRIFYNVILNLTMFYVLLPSGRILILNLRSPPCELSKLQSFALNWWLSSKVTLKINTSQPEPETRQRLNYNAHYAVPERQPRSLYKFIKQPNTATINSFFATKWHPKYCDYSIFNSISVVSLYLGRPYTGRKLTGS